MEAVGGAAEQGAAGTGAAAGEVEKAGEGGV
jgi:hypothetical protein